MASNKLKKRKQRDIFIGIVIVLVVVAATQANSIKAWLIPPDLPGYLAQPPAGNFTQLDWKQLLQGGWEAGHEPEVPQTITTLAGKTVTIRGFLLPLHTPGEASEFFLAPKPRGCYFCFPPGISEVIHIKVAGGKLLGESVNWPVVVYGTFKVAAGKTADTALYTIDDAELMIPKKR